MHVALPRQLRLTGEVHLYSDGTAIHIVRDGRAGPVVGMVARRTRFFYAVCIPDGLGWAITRLARTDRIRATGEIAVVLRQTRHA